LSVNFGRKSFIKSTLANRDSLFKSFFTPKLRGRLSQRGLPTKLDGSINTCHASEACRSLLKMGAVFYKQVSIL
jgi:hypothetical protein